MVAAAYHSRQMIIKYISCAASLDEEAQATLWNMIIPWQGVKVGSKKLCEALMTGMEEDDVMGAAVRANVKKNMPDDIKPGQLTLRPQGDKTGAY